MSASSQSSTSPTGVVDPLDLLDLSEYDGLPYQSPAVSPATTSKPQFARTSTTMTATPATVPPSRPMSGPSHQYDQYKQQTPFVPGALASTLAINENNSQISGYLDYVNPSDDLFDFNTVPSQNSLNSSDMDIDFESPTNQPFFFQQPSTINPSAVDSHDSQLTSPTVAPQTGSVGRMYPGMHQQAALAKQRQQQQIIQQQQQRQGGKQSRSKAPLPTDPIVEQKITQLLNSMRSKASGPDAYDNSPLLQIPKPRKDEDDMDEDERLLASEEGKKLSSKERRQLRNKVSARAFRSRRKEYIGQLESEIATKVAENGDLRAQNRALADENRRLSDLTRMLLSSPSFSNFLDHLSANPSALPPAPQPQHQTEQTQAEPRHMSKDVNPYSAIGHNQQQQQIGMVMIPEQTMDFSMLSINSDAFNYQPQVFAVLETPEMPEIDTEVLTGKSSNFVGTSLSSDSEKNEVPVIEAPALPALEKAQPAQVPAEARRTTPNPDRDLYDEEDLPAASSPLELDTNGLSPADIFGGIEPEKAFARYELIDASEEEAVATIALRRVERLSASLEATFQRLSLLSMD